jgi:hypothetical protein
MSHVTPTIPHPQHLTHNTRFSEPSDHIAACSLLEFVPKLKPAKWSICAGEQLSESEKNFEIEKAVVEKEADVSRVVAPKLGDTSRTYELGTFRTAVFKNKYQSASKKEIREDLSALWCMQCEQISGTIQVTCAARVFQCACVISPVLTRCVTSQTAGSSSTHCVVDAMLRNSAVLAALPLLAGSRCLECVMLPAFASRMSET